MDIGNPIKIILTFKSAKPNENHPRVQKKLAEKISEPLAIIFENSCRTGETRQTGHLVHSDESLGRGTIVNARSTDT